MTFFHNFYEQKRTLIHIFFIFFFKHQIYVKHNLILFMVTGGVNGTKNNQNKIMS